MEITNVRLRLLDKEDSRVKGFADIVIDDCFAVHGIAIIDGENGYFLGFPFREEANGNGEQNEKPKRFDIAHPINKSCQRMIEDKVLDAYDEKMNEDS